LTVIDRQARRNWLRYPGYDYAQAGAVFVTICTQGRQRLFGAVVDGAVTLTPAAARLEQIPDRFPGVMIDAFIVMPDHIHGIFLTGADPAMAVWATPGEIVRWYKCAMFADYSRGVRSQGWEPYDRQLWQRDYYDHIIRNDADLDRIRAYIETNPARWEAKNT
jgi:putative transposase